LKLHENNQVLLMSIAGGGKSDLNLGLFNEPSGTEASDDYSETLELSEGEMQDAKGVWLEFHSKMEEHHKLPSVAFRKIDDERKGFITQANVKRIMLLMGIRCSPIQLRAIINGLGCDPKGRVTVMDYRRASELSLPDALKIHSVPRPLLSPSPTLRRGGGGGGEPAEHKRLRLIASQRSLSFSDSYPDAPSLHSPSSKPNFYNGEGSTSLYQDSAHSLNKSRMPTLVFTPRKDPIVERALQKDRNRAEGARNRPLLLTCVTSCWHALLALLVQKNRY
jgi:hypothetical protein